MYRAKHVASIYQQILSPNLLELWITGVGMTLAAGQTTSYGTQIGVTGTNVLSWRGVLQGLTWQAVTAARAPAYVADGSNFRGVPIVQFYHPVAYPAQNPPRGFATLQPPAQGLSTDVGMLFYVGRQLVDNQKTNQDFEHVMSMGRGLASGVGGTNAWTMNFNQTAGASNHGMMGETWQQSDGNHNFPGLFPEVTPQLYHGSVGCSNASNQWPCYLARADKFKYGGAISTPIGQADFLRLGLLPEIDRGCNFGCALAGWCRAQPTASQLSALIALCNAEWGTPTT